MSGNIYEILSDLLAGQNKIISSLKELMSNSQTKKVYDLKELGDDLNVSRRTISKWTKEGILPHSKVGNKIFVTTDQFKEFLDNHNNSENCSVLKPKG